MNKPQPTVKDFLTAFQDALHAGSFVKLSLSAYTGKEENLKSLHIRCIMIKREEKLSFTYRYKTRDIVKNHAAPEALTLIGNALAEEFGTAMLMTTACDLFYDGKKLKTSLPRHSETPALTHDRAKERLITTAPDKRWLHDLQITGKDGKILHNAQDKFRQINRYVEILSGLITEMPEGSIGRVTDMGSGKGYLTFALYDYLSGTLGLPVCMTGVELRRDMVALCNTMAAASNFTGLNFVESSIADYNTDGTDLLIALHACDTATDDAIAKGIEAGAALIVVAPCCHKQIRREMEQNKTENDQDFLLKHGIFRERQAEMVTDALRALILNYFGYETKVFEFISDAHTPKNVMIVGSKNSKLKAKDPAIVKKIADAKARFGISRHYLETRMGVIDE